MLKITKNLNLKDFSGMSVGTNILSDLHEISQENDIVEIFENEEFTKNQFFVIGTGSNTIFTSNKKINLLKINFLEIIESEGQGERVIKVGAGVDWDQFVQKYLEIGGVGLEALSIIPGTVGAAPVQNIGAYGVEVCEFIESVEVFNTHTKMREILLNIDCDFSYRNSIFKKNISKYIILYVNFKIKYIEGDKEKYKNKILGYKDLVNFFDLNNKNNKAEFIKNLTSEEIRNAIIAIRNGKFPKWGAVYNCGSFFANPIISRAELKKVQEKFPEIPVFAVVGMGDKAKEEDEKVKIPIAYIIEKIGLKGYNSNFDIKNESGEIGNFGIYKNHALIVVSNAKGTVSEFLKFIKMIKQKVYDASGLKIVEEVNLI